MDFTFDTYRQLCTFIRDSNFYRTTTIANYIKNPDSNVILLRHDVDRKPRNAEIMAQLERDYGLCATYYVRSVAGWFNTNLLKSLANLGHEVGYHYETLSLAKGDIPEALRLFQKSLDLFRSVVPVETVCVHGRPLSPWNNLDIWHKANLEEFGLVGEPYCSLNFNQIKYFSDTGRTWHSSKFNIRDTVTTDLKTTEAEIETTDQLIEVIRSKRYDRLMIQSHPNRWSSGKLEWAISAGSDIIINFGKIAVAKLYKTASRMKKEE